MVLDPADIFSRELNPGHDRLQFGAYLANQPPIFWSDWGNMSSPGVNAYENVAQHKSGIY